MYGINDSVHTVLSSIITLLVFNALHALFKFAWVGCGIRLCLIHIEDVINYTQSFNMTLLLSKLCFQTTRYSDSFIFLLNKPYSRKRSETDRPNAVLYFSCHCSSAFYLSLTFFALLRRIDWWPSAGRDTKCMQFKCKVKNLRHSEAEHIMVMVKYGSFW